MVIIATFVFATFRSQRAAANPKAIIIIIKALAAGCGAKKNLLPRKDVRGQYFFVAPFVGDIIVFSFGRLILRGHAI